MNTVFTKVYSIIEIVVNKTYETSIFEQIYYI